MDAQKRPRRQRERGEAINPTYEDLRRAVYLLNGLLAAADKDSPEREAEGRRLMGIVADYHGRKLPLKPAAPPPKHEH